MADRIRIMSNGRLDIKVYGAGELVGAFEVFDAVSRGTAQMGNGASYYWRSKLPVAAIFSTVPFGLTAQEMNGWLHYGGGMELWRELYEPFGLIPMAAGNTGVQMGGWFNKEINSPADLEGLKMRIPGLGGQVLERLGGVPVSMPGSDVFTSLQTGVIDATEWVGPYNDLAFGLHTIAKYYYYPGWHEPGAAIESIVNADAWASLPLDLQIILETAVRMTNDDVLAEYTARNAEALQTLVNDHGVELRRFPDAVLARLWEASAAVVAELAGEDPLNQRILDSHARFTTLIRAYHDITERAYINSRAASSAGGEAVDGP
jgi:TRAP-type mannitol/chloroaromatic compound transport system substrate-binding protein